MLHRDSNGIALNNPALTHCVAEHENANFGGSYPNGGAIFTHQRQAGLGAKDPDRHNDRCKISPKGVTVDVGWVVLI